MELFWHIASILGACGIPIGVAMMSSYTMLRDRLIRTETIVDDRVKKVDAISDRQIATDLQIASHAQSLIQLKELSLLLGSQFALLATKLESIPRIDENVKNMTEAVRGLATKEEVKHLQDNMEMRVKNVEDRLNEVSRAGV